MNKKIILIGDIFLDHYFQGECSRISPEAPVPVFEIKSENYLPGGVANIAFNLKNARLDVTVASIIGDDNNGQIAEEILRKLNIKCVFLKIKNRKTTVKTRILSNDQQLLRIDDEDLNNISENEEFLFLNLVLPFINQFEYLVLSNSINGFSSKTIEQICHVCDQFSIKIINDTDKSQLKELVESHRKK